MVMNHRRPARFQKGRETGSCAMMASHRASRNPNTMRAARRGKGACDMRV